MLPSLQSNEKRRPLKRKVLPRILVKEGFNQNVSSLPPILFKQPNTKAALYKDCVRECTPSEAIGSNFSPSAAYINIRDLPPRRRKPVKCVVPRSGPLGYPPKELIAKINYLEKLSAEKKKKKIREEPGFVTLQDLLSGEYRKRKAEEKQKREQRLAAAKRLRIEKRNKINQDKELRNLRRLEAEPPMDPDSQREILLALYRREGLRNNPAESDIVKINWYLRNAMPLDTFLDYPTIHIEKARKRIDSNLLGKPEFRALLKMMQDDIEEEYKESLRRALLEYVLLDRAEWTRLGISGCAVRFPCCQVRAPVTWHTPRVIALQLIERNLFIGNPILLKLRHIWQTQYADMVIIRKDKLLDGYLPMTVQELGSRVDSLCREARIVLTTKWLVTCSSVFSDHVQDWRGLVPTKAKGSLALVERLFSCVAALMSIQVRSLVIKSLSHFSEILHHFKGGNEFNGEYKDFLFANIPLIVLRVQREKDTADLNLDPPLEAVHQFFLSCFTKIINVNLALPRVETILFGSDMKHQVLHLHPILEHEEQVQDLIIRSLSYFKTNIIGPKIYCSMYQKYDYIFVGKAKMDVLNLFSQAVFPPLKDFTQQIEDYERICDEIRFLRRLIPLNMVCLDCSDLNDELLQLVSGLRAHIIEYFVNENRTHNRSICNVFDEMSSRASELPETTAQLVELTNYLIESRDVTMYDLKAKIQITAQNVLFLMQHSNLQVEDIQLNSRVFLWPKDMGAVLDLATTRLSHRRDAVENALRVRRSEFDDTLLAHQKELDLFKKKDPPILTVEEMAECVEGIEDLMRKLKEDKQESDSINDEEQLLDWEMTPFMNLGSMLQAVEPFDQLWHVVHQWHVSSDKWFYGPFKGLNAEEIKEKVEEVWRILSKLAKTFHDVPGSKRVAEMARARVEKFRQYVPVLQCVCNPGLQHRHWVQMSQVLGAEIAHPDNASLHDMIELGMIKYVGKLEEISLAATKEYQLENALGKMKTEWDVVSFECIPYRETGVNILSAVDDIQVMLDDHILKAQTMRGSPYVKAFEHEMQNWEDKLISMQDILDAWLLCQATWMYLEPIFSSEDIMRQMPEESRKFKAVDKTWRSVMSNTTKDTRVLAATGQTDMLKKLKECNALLDEIQKGLNDYLEKKRMFFPRFFFLSNDELLEILSETKDPQRVQPHLRKCFEGISRLHFNQDEEIVSMVSAEEEVVSLSGKIIPAEAKGMVEKWLSQVETLMVQSIHDICMEAVSAYVNSPRETWVVSFPGQVVLCASSIHWTSHVELAIPENTLPDLLTKCNMQIEKLVKLVREPLSTGTRTTICALIVLDVHARDVVKQLLDTKTTNSNDFNWMSQLRYYWKNGTAVVSMITTHITYGFEYLGNTQRLVVTPLTDRCYRTLMGAMKLNLGGATEGPAATGKTETCKDLAKAVAKQCVVFNCSEGLDYRAMGKFFKGLAQSGAWACFDEFNRMGVEVLSVIAQQIATIQTAIQQKSERFIFEGTEISLNPTCNIFITMNPGYAGRHELPDNLKMLFRTVAMMVPDYVMIAEISLFSMGFLDAKRLAEKIVNTYKLCSEQLSGQRHYDYGMRAVKAVINAAGHLRRKYQDLSEEVLVLRAILDVNLPKFLSEDVPLFDGIISDLFPGAQPPKEDRDQLLELIKCALAHRNLQATPWYLDKIIQIYDMMLVRHGLMIIGRPFGGKTNAYQCLAECLGKLKMDDAANECKTQVRVINPKALTIGQLYGSYDSASHEWSDGVLATTFREFASSSSTDRKWIVHDGPVDAIWIENLNTVLDDNKKLCLMSGEIIQMSPRMRMIFEPGDLDEASPATVSRCGMIYMEPERLGWRALYASHVANLKKKLLGDQIELVDELVQWLVPPMLVFASTQCQRFVNTSEMHSFLIYSRLLEGMLEEESQFATNWLQFTVIFCLVWGIGGLICGDSRNVFDHWIRQVLLDQDTQVTRPKNFKMTKNQIFPDKENVFCYYFDKKNNGTWVTWLAAIEKSTGTPTFEKVTDIVVPTNETALQKFFMNKCGLQKLPVLFVGPTGTGKSTVALNYIASLPKEKFLCNVVNFSARTSANRTQEIIMSKLDRRRKGVFGPAMGKQCLLFVDDLSISQREKYGAQPSIELLRQWLDHSHWYDLKDTSKLELVDILSVGAMLPESGVSMPLSSRFLRHHQIFGIESLHEATMNRIFSSIMDWHMGKGFEESIKRLSKGVVNAAIHVYQQAVLHFLPVPSKWHYTFNLRDLSRVIRGITLAPSSVITDPDKFIRIFIHESYRTFQDRLVDDADKKKFFDIVKEASAANFRQSIDKVCSNLMPDEAEHLNENHIRNLFFGNYMEPDAMPKYYDEVTDLQLLETKLKYYLREHNVISKRPLSMVLFKFVMEHVSRISRVLIQTAGHVLLVGVSGSGRKSAALLAASMADYAVYQLEITRDYNYSNWRDDLKILFKKCGIDNRPTVFVYQGVHDKDEAFFEDINMVLTSGDVPNLYQADEKVEILEKMTTALQELGRKTEMTPLALYNFFIQRVRENLHVVLIMSPDGEYFRKRIAAFPSLINCCTIDWFGAWPNDALETVAMTFISKNDLKPSILNQAMEMCKVFHTSVEATAVEYYKSLKRAVYVTPTSYLVMLKTFNMLYEKRVEQITTQRNRYETGLEKLDFAASQVSVMQDKLHILQPKLIETSEKTEKLMIKIEQDTVVVEAKKEIVGADEALANEAAAAAQAIKDDCESDLSEAIPALEAAVHALDTLKPSDITVVKSMKNPPYGVKLVMESVCVMKQMKAERKPDPSGNGKMVEDYWGTSLKLLGDLKFLESLKTYDKDNIPPAVMQRIRERYIPDRGFDPNNIKQVSAACEGLCKWVRAMEVYDRVIKIVAPKKAKLAEAEAELELQMKTLNEKRTQLQEVTDKLQALNDEFAAMTKQKKELEDSIESCSQKLDRAEKLIAGLGGEKARWSEIAADLVITLDHVLGDVLLAAGVIVYLGAFNMPFRQKLLTSWIETCICLKLPFTRSFTLTDTLGDAVEIRQWHMAGLPVDSFSVDNAIIVNNSFRWPLIIDPQAQANKWIKSAEKANRLAVLKFTDNDYLQKLKLAVKNGNAVIIENVGEELDPGIDSLLARNLFSEGGIDHLQIGDSAVPYCSDFRLYITTRLSNPHFSPEVAVKVTLINFVLTQEGLQTQLLRIVVGKERPELEDQKNELISTSASNKKLLKEIEDKILEVLSSSKGNILEDESANQILTSSKILSEEVQEKQKLAQVTETEIDESRNMYKSVSNHAAILFFCIADLAHLNPMYQYSLTWFLRLYHWAIESSEKAKGLDDRLSIINKNLSSTFYNNVCRGLFEKDKLIFSCSICFSLLRAKDEINEDILEFLLTDTAPLESPPPNPASSWLSDASWRDVVTASAIPKFSKLRNSVKNHVDKWRTLYYSDSPQYDEFPPPFNQLNHLERIAVLKCIRSDKVLPAMQAFIASQIELKESEPLPSLDLDRVWAEATALTPFIFVVTPGADPMAALFDFAEAHSQRKTMKAVSLGQEQGPIAESAITNGMKNGNWVVVQNCHLAVSWLPELDKIIQEVLIPEKTNKDFRLWLITHSCDNFPVSILQNGIRITIDTPRGLKKNMMKAYMSKPIADSTFYEGCKQTDNWRKLLFGLVFFNAVVQERRGYGSLGWNRPYAFCQSDLIISAKQLQMFLNDEDNVPFETLKYLIGECNYGGRVTDDRDRRLLNSLLSTVLCKEIIEENKFAFSPDKVYGMPHPMDYSTCLQYIQSLPPEARPEVVGLHDNANTTKDSRETAELLNGMMKMQVTIQPRVLEANVSQVIEVILQQLPPQFVIDDVEKKFPICHENSMNIVLKQEVMRYNRLLSTIGVSLDSVRRAARGEIVMTVELEAIYKSLLYGQIPHCWKQISYPTLKLLGAYIKDLLLRIKFFSDWIEQGEPKVFWISGFFFTQSFLTAILQNFSRFKMVAIDKVAFNFEFTQFEANVRVKEEPPYGVFTKCLPPKHTRKEFSDFYKLKSGIDLGVFVEGLFLEGACWNRNTQMLDESESKIAFDFLPIILFKPVIKGDSEKSGAYYECPVYKTSDRHGDVSTTGHSTNFVMYMKFPCQDALHWTNRSAACLCQLDD